MKIVNKAGETEILIYEDIGLDPWFGGGVGARDIIKALKEAPPKNRILVRLNSPGGDVFEGLAIYNALAQSDREIVTQVDGMAFSAASYIFMAAPTRRIAENAFLMIHEAWGFTSGTADEMRARADALEEITDSIAKIYEAGTGRPRADIDAWMKAETFLTVNPDGDSVLDAIEMGFATESIENLRVAARFDPKKYRIQNPPEALAAMMVGNTQRGNSQIASMNQRASKVQRDLRKGSR